MPHTHASIREKNLLISELYKRHPYQSQKGVHSWWALSCSAWSRSPRASTIRSYPHGDLLPMLKITCGLLEFGLGGHIFKFTKDTVIHAVARHTIFVCAAPFCHIYVPRKVKASPVKAYRTLLGANNARTAIMYPFLLFNAARMKLKADSRNCSQDKNTRSTLGSL